MLRSRGSSPLALLVGGRGEVGRSPPRVLLTLYFAINVGLRGGLSPPAPPGNRLNLIGFR